MPTTLVKPGNVHFLVMEFVDGKDLSAMVKKNGPFPVNKAVNYILQAARGIGVRSLRRCHPPRHKARQPSLGQEGCRQDSRHGTRSHRVGWWPCPGRIDRHWHGDGYRRLHGPEQALNTKHADARADIYSLGISLYYLIAGRAAYGGDSLMEKLVAHREQPIPSLQEAQTTVPKQLDAVFKKMVAKKIEDRYQTMTEVVAALERLGYGGSGTSNLGDLASTIDLSSADKKKLAKTKKKPLGSITEVVASEKTKYFFAKIIGGAFGTIIAPILVFYLIRHLEKQEQPANPPAATVPAAVAQPVAVAKPADPDRAVAEWVLSKHGSVRLDSSGGEYVRQASALPTQRFVVQAVTLSRATVASDKADVISDTDLAQLLPLKEVQTLNVSEQPDITEEGLATISKITSLTTILLNGTSVTDQGLSDLRSLPNLTKLHIIRRGYPLRSDQRGRSSAHC